eukprot:2436436-Prymnesium_polylepis.1
MLQLRLSAAPHIARACVGGRGRATVCGRERATVCGRERAKVCGRERAKVYGRERATELQGVAARGCFDLSAHADASGKSMEYYDEERKEKYVPHVIEPSIGVRATARLAPQPARPAPRPGRTALRAQHRAQDAHPPAQPPERTAPATHSPMNAQPPAQPAAQSLACLPSRSHLHAQRPRQL